jgi:hypothetical protein
MPGHECATSKSSKGCNRSVFNPELKARAALREDQIIAELCQQFELRHYQITEWKKQLLDNAAGVFVTTSKDPAPVDLGLLQKKSGSRRWKLIFWNTHSPRRDY